MYIYIYTVYIYVYIYTHTITHLTNYYISIYDIDTCDPLLPRLKAKWPWQSSVGAPFVCRGGQLPSRDANLHAISLGGHECLGAGHSSGVGSSVDDDAQGWFNKKILFFGIW